MRHDSHPTVLCDVPRITHVWALAIVVLLILLTPATALAHAYPVRSEPSPNATVAKAPPTVEIWFGEHLEPLFSNMVVYDAHKHGIQTRPSQVDPHDHYHMVVRLKPHLPAGTYTVVWHAVSADDGHSTAGVFAFGVGEAAQLPVIPAQKLGAAQGQEATIAGVVGRWLVYLGAVVLLGAATFVFLVIGSKYGQSLLLKHVAILALLLAAAPNHFVTVPVLTGRRKLTAFPGLIRRLVGAGALRAVGVEAALGLVVLLSTGLLTSLAPARSPQQILLDPARELPLGTQPFQTTLPLTNGERARLVINPGRVGANMDTISVGRDVVPVRDVQRAYLELTPLELAGTAPNVQELTPTGTERFVGRGLELSTEGLWRAAVQLYYSNGSISNVDTTIQATSQWSATTGSQAIRLLAQAEQAMAQLRQARMVESLSDGAGGLGLTDYTFVAPDREQIVSPFGGAVIHIGTTLYQRETGSSSWSVEHGATPYL
ncbi:MAG TPA: copper resistance protein CopC [Chloroflexota bacterium]|nr:copper resistance protein CopC [Chloroflexota bacterium]